MAWRWVTLAEPDWRVAWKGTVSSASVWPLFLNVSVSGNSECSR